MNSLWSARSGCEQNCLEVFMYFGVMHSDENDVCGATLSLYPHRAS